MHRTDLQQCSSATIDKQLLWAEQVPICIGSNMKRAYRMPEYNNRTQSAEIKHEVSAVEIEQKRILSELKRLNGGIAVELNSTPIRSSSSSCRF